MIDLSYANILKLIQPYKEGRTDSTAFLHWFLVNIYRLERMEVDDIVCDGHGDKGIDGIYIDDNECCVDVFQAKIVQNDLKTLGDTQLKEFMGSLDQLKTKSSLISLTEHPNINTQLKNLLIAHGDKILSRDYIVRGIFITNARKDCNAENLIEAVAETVKIEVWDKDKISRMYVSSEKAIRTTSELSLDVFGWNYSEHNVDNLARVVIASISATDIVRMEGIHNQEVFDLNLRKSLGKTKVNKDIYESIKNPEEHKKFLLYHNGITIICSHLDTRDSRRQDQN